MIAVFATLEALRGGGKGAKFTPGAIDKSLNTHFLNKRTYLAESQLSYQLTS